MKRSSASALLLTALASALAGVFGFDAPRAGAVRPGPIYARIWVDQDLKKKMGY